MGGRVRTSLYVRNVCNLSQRVFLQRFVAWADKTSDHFCSKLNRPEYVLPTGLKYYAVFCRFGLKRGKILRSSLNKGISSFLLLNRVRIPLLPARTQNSKI